MSNPASELAKKRWKKVGKKERSAIMKAVRNRTTQQAKPAQ